MRQFARVSLLLALAAPGGALAAPPMPAPPMPAPTVPVRVAMAQPVLPPLPTPRRVIAPPSTPSRTEPRQAVAADPATLCETAVTTAEYVNRLPPRLLAAISLTETGRIDPANGRIRPWPWTINAEGVGAFFQTGAEAIAAVKALQAKGVRSIDVGCLQVNLMYHPDAFASLENAFDPRDNANYAARFLNALNAGSNDWTAAIAAYHSETRELGDAYRVLVMARWQNGDPHVQAAGQSVYGDFASGGNPYGEGTKAAGASAYGAFAPRSLVYGDFAPR
jgi:soluble lytic murein transglycosylase-like protein